ncbi:Predicted PurR-regulated permease PerM [Pseudoduganella namucuonensis]|uniref:Predicted PurR-regulated permease PerM n=1 Tax=Pseudoduganella namucuonensis TaxID=1035707 RepID=A0A1I7LN35_9BURK|nr:Predicted PurR-regulated permease PerM [Pseudoduganella namucuonensis]
MHDDTNVIMMKSPHLPVPTVAILPSPQPIARLQAGSILGAGCLLTALHFGRPVLQPIALAAILSLVAAPLIRALCRLGLRRLPAMVAVLLLSGACLAGAGLVLAFQLVAVSAELPQYRAAIQRKAETLRAAVERPFAHVQAGLDAVAPLAPAAAPPAPAAQAAAPAPPTAPTAPAALAKLAGLAWGPLGETGLVLVLLMFILLEHESLQDRLIRLAGQAEVSRTVRALADAARGVSRFFFCQFIVNTVFGAAMGLALWAAGLPHAALWGALCGVLRFVPYVGALAAGAAIACFAAAVDPGWSLTLSCLAMFGALELVVAHLVEPKVYGLSTGLSPLAVVVSALFWGTLWGPAGLLISTPLTVCLVVAGRHVGALEPLAILFGQAPDVTAAQRFFQRGLSGETGAILRDAAAMLRRASFARYCDQILLPGLALASSELRLGLIDGAQREHLRRAVAEVAETLAPSGAAPVRRRRHVSLLDANVGAHLRRLREARLGRWQGPLDVPQRSIVLCAGLASERDELVGELLARALREAGVDARSVALPLPHTEHDAGKAALVSTVFVPYPLAEELETWRRAVAALRVLLPGALLATIRLPGDEAAGPAPAILSAADMDLRSFEECVAFVAPRRTAG